MRSTRSVLALKYTPVSVAGGVRKAVGGFLRYVQYRDQHVEPERDGGLDAYVRYVAHRDRTSPGGRVFGGDGDRSDRDRRPLVEHVMRSIKGLSPKRVQGRDGKPVDRQRAVYQFVLSPEEWRGLDLRRIARAAMKQLETDAGVGGLGPWIAAEHRNTAHHHVHIVLAARREVAPDRFTTLVITRARLERMKEAIGREIDHQRGHERAAVEKGPLTRRALLVAPMRLSPATNATRHRTHLGALHFRPRRRPMGLSKIGGPFAEGLIRLRGTALLYRYRMERELENDLLRRERETQGR